MWEKYNKQTLCLNISSFAGAPKKCEFLTDTLNIIDVLSILPFFVSLFFESDLKSDILSLVNSVSGTNMTSTTPAGVTTPAPDDDQGVGSFEDILQIFRIFKLARYKYLIYNKPKMAYSRYAFTGD